MKKLFLALVAVAAMGVLSIPAAAQAGRIPGKTCKGFHYRSVVVSALTLRGDVSCRMATTLAKRYYDAARPINSQKGRYGFPIPGYP